MRQVPFLSKEVGSLCQARLQRPKLGIGWILIFFFFLDSSLFLGTQSVVQGPAAAAPPRSFLEMQNPGPHPELLHQNLHIDKVPKGFTGT